MRSWPWPWLLASAILAVFLATGVRHLDTVPQVYEDEPWQASAGDKLATQRGSDLFAGFFHMDQRYYGFMPLHPLLRAGCAPGTAADRAFPGQHHAGLQAPAAAAASRPHSGQSR